MSACPELLRLRAAALGAGMGRRVSQVLWRRLEGAQRRVTFELSAEEIEVLIEEMDGRLSELQSELAHTDRKEFRQMLKSRKALMEGILGRLRQTSVAA